MVVDMYIIGPKKDQFKLVFFGLFDFSKMKRPRPRLQKTNKQSFLVLVLFGLSPVRLQSFASPRTGLSNTRDREVSDKVHGDLLEQAGAFRGDGCKRGVGGVGVDFIGLAHGTASDKFVDKGGHSWPPLVLLEE